MSIIRYKLPLCTFNATDGQIPYGTQYEPLLWILASWPERREPSLDVQLSFRDDSRFTSNWYIIGARFHNKLLRYKISSFYSKLPV